MANRLGPGHPDQLPDKLLKKNSVYKRCKKCNGLKPIRTHHCSICDSCNIQMDRNFSVMVDHCPWMGTCIGQQNRAYFIKFLSYLTGGSYLVVTLIHEFRMPRNFLFISDDEVYMFLYTIFWVIGGFTLFHWGIALIGRTTLETFSILDGYKPKTWDICHNF